MTLSEFLTQFGLSLESMLLSIFIGLMLALGILAYNKLVLGRIVRILTKNAVHSPEAAITLEQAGLERSFLTMFSLRDGSMMRKVITCIPAETDGLTRRGKTDLRRARFYLPEKNIERATVAYNNNGTSVVTVFLTVLIFLAMIILIAILVPNIITMIQNLIEKVQTEFEGL